MLKARRQTVRQTATDGPLQLTGLKTYFADLCAYVTTVAPVVPVLLEGEEGIKEVNRCTVTSPQGT